MKYPYLLNITSFVAVARTHNYHSVLYFAGCVNILLGEMKLRVSKTQPCVGSLVVAEMSKLPVEVSWVAGQNELDAGLLVALNTDANIAR